MENKQFLLDAFSDDLADTVWLLNKDTIYADSYFDLLARIKRYDTMTDTEVEDCIEQIYTLRSLYYERAKDSSTWVAPKKQIANELVHNENGKLTEESIALLQKTISDKNSEKILVSDTGKTISFGEKWHTMLQNCGFKSTAINRLTDFISKFIEADGWVKYFVGNIGKNNKRLIQEYHPMDKYNLDHNTNYAAMHLGGDTTKCVLVSVDTASSDGRGEPSGITFLEIGAHTIIDRFIVGSFRPVPSKQITEATVDELVELFSLN